LVEGFPADGGRGAASSSFERRRSHAASIAWTASHEQAAARSVRPVAAFARHHEKIPVIRQGRIARGTTLIERAYRL